MTRIAIVVRDDDGAAWLRIGPDRWAMMEDAMRGAKYAERWTYTRAEIEQDGPVVEEWFVEEQS